jgi:hypothetical protein
MSDYNNQFQSVSVDLIFNFKKCSMKKVLNRLILINYPMRLINYLCQYAQNQKVIIRYVIAKSAKIKYVNSAKNCIFVLTLSGN